MENKKSVSKKVLLLILLISIIVVLIVVLAFGLFFKSKDNDDKKDYNAGVITMNYSDSTNFKITNLIPVTDSVGMNFNDAGTYYDFIVDTKMEDSDEVSYEVAISVNEDETNVDLSNLKVYLEKQESGSYSKVLAPTIFKPLSKSSSFGTPKGAMVLFKNKVVNNSNDNYRLRVWMDEKTVTVPNTVYTISVNVDVYGHAE